MGAIYLKAGAAASKENCGATYGASDWDVPANYVSNLVSLTIYYVGPHEASSNIALRLPSDTQTAVTREINQSFDDRIRPWAEDIRSRLSSLLNGQSVLSQSSGAILEKLVEACLKLNDGTKDEKAVAVLLLEPSKHHPNFSLSFGPHSVLLFVLTFR